MNDPPLCLASSASRKAGKEERGKMQHKIPGNEAFGIEALRYE